MTINVSTQQFKILIVRFSSWRRHDSVSAVYFFLFPLLTFLSPSSLSAVYNSFCVAVVSPSFSYSFHISLNAVLPSQSQSFSSPFCQFSIFHSLYTDLFQSTPDQFLLITFLHSNLHSQLS